MDQPKITLLAQHSLIRSCLKSKSRVWYDHATHENGQGAGSKIRLAYLLYRALLVFLVLWRSRRPGKNSMCGWRQKKFTILFFFFFLCKSSDLSEWLHKSSEGQVLKHEQVPAQFIITNQVTDLIALMQG